MMNKVEIVEKLPYLQEAEIYALWRYLNGHTTGRSVFQFADLTAPHASWLLTVQFLLNQFSLWGVIFENPVFHSHAYFLLHQSQYYKIRDLIKRSKDKRDKES